MKKVYTALLLCLLFTGHSYGGGFANLQISPALPETSDSIKLSYIYYAVKYPAAIFTHQVDITNFSIFTNVCFGQGQRDFGVTLYDTINLGVYSAPGTYHVTLYMNNTSLLDTLCSQSIWYDSAEITFSVSGPNGIVPAVSDGNSTISLYPNPTNNKLNCVIDKPTPNSTLQLFTPTGLAAAPAMPVTQANTEVDISALPAGLYFLHLQDDKQRVVKKFVKY